MKLFKKLCCAALLLGLSSTAFAQNPLGDNNMQGMMQEMQKIQECMMQIDQSALQALGEKAQQVQADIQAACDKGDVKGAEEKALDFVNTVKASPEMQQMQTCTKGLPDMMQGHVPYTNMQDIEKDFSKKDICSM